MTRRVRVKADSIERQGENRPDELRNRRLHAGEIDRSVVGTKEAGTGAIGDEEIRTGKRRRGARVWTVSPVQEVKSAS